MGDSVHTTPLSEDYRKMAADLGYSTDSDINGGNQTGFAVPQVNIDQGVRRSTYHTYLKPAAWRANLRVARHAMVQRLLVEEGRAVGVEFSRFGRTRTARAGREVVVAAGAVGSPTLLLLSGIGPADHLRQVW